MLRSRLHSSSEHLAAHDQFAQYGSSFETPLPGSPTLPFHTRCNLLWAEQCRGSWMSLAFTIAIAYRCWHLLSPASAIWLLISLVAALADVAWRRLQPRSYPRWRELLAALLCFNAFGPGTTWILMRRMLDDQGLPAGASWAGGASWMGALAGCAVHLVLLMFGSGAVKMAANALSMRVRLGLSAAVQLALVVAPLPFTRHICTTAPFAHPTAQRLTHRLYRLVGGVAGLAAVAAPPAARPTPDAECAVLLTWLRVTIAMLAPLSWQALSDARLFRRHQAERRAAGLPPEHGLHAVLFGMLGAPRWELGALHAVVISWLLLALTWDWSVDILVPLGAGSGSLVHTDRDCI